MMLDEFRANPNIPTLLGNTTCLHIACEMGLRQMASVLITYGAEVNARDCRGCTPLHICSNKACVKLLMRYETVDATIKTNEGLLPSEHYWKYTDEDDRIAEIQTILMRFEDKQTRDKIRTEREMHKAMFNFNMGERDEYPHATSQNSTIITEKGPKGMKMRTILIKRAKEEKEALIEKQKFKASQKTMGRIGMKHLKDTRVRIVTMTRCTMCVFVSSTMKTGSYVYKQRLLFLAIDSDTTKTFLSFSLQNQSL